MPKDTGGPAFPRRQHNSIIDRYGNRPTVHGHGGHPGMTLRDWFAGQALLGFLQDELGNDPEWVAKCCYNQADAMIAERNKDESAN